jgi:hypothetical protein
MCCSEAFHCCCLFYNMLVSNNDLSWLLTLPISGDWSCINTVASNVLTAKFNGPVVRHGLQNCLGSSVCGYFRKTDSYSNRRNIDNPSIFLKIQKTPLTKRRRPRALTLCSISNSFKTICSRRCSPANTSVIHDNINLNKCLHGCINNLRCFHPLHQYLLN